MPNLYVIGGASGSGKTTVSLSLLPTLLGVFEYVNADAIAAGLSPLNPEAMAMQSGRLMVKRIEHWPMQRPILPLRPLWQPKALLPFLENARTKATPSI